MQICSYDIAEPPEVFAVKGRFKLFFLILELSCRATVEICERLAERLRLLACAFEKVAFGIKAV